MPRNHTGKGTLIVDGQHIGSVDFQVGQEDVNGWQLVRGTLAGDRTLLAYAFDHGQVDLRHDATGFLMHLTVTDVSEDGVAHVAVDVS